MKIFLAVILVVAFLSYLMIKRGRAMKSRFYGKNEDEINSELKKMIL